jgi:iodotyrosine deiodinase
MQRELDFTRLSEAEMRARADALFAELVRRRTVRDFSSEPIPLDVVERAIETAAQAPSGANKQPWTFVLVTDPEVKRRIRAAAEEEERAFYNGRAPERWLRDLEPLGTDEHKPFLTTAPALVVVFAQRHGADADERHYYVSESVGIAVGFLLAALHHAGLATLTHTPSPMAFLGEILGRPANERAYLLVPVGYPAPGCRVPDISRKSLDEVLVRA